MKTSLISCSSGGIGFCSIHRPVTSNSLALTSPSPFKTVRWNNLSALLFLQCLRLHILWALAHILNLHALFTAERCKPNNAYTQHDVDIATICQSPGRTVIAQNMKHLQQNVCKIWAWRCIMWLPCAIHKSHHVPRHTSLPTVNVTMDTSRALRLLGKLRR